MIKYSQDLNRLVNPAKMADDTVLALASIKRGGKVSIEFLKEGIELCDYLISLQEIKDIQKILMTVTMPMWQKRTLEFREKKLKRGLIIRG